MIRCPCCGYLTIEEEYDICQVCYWQYDEVRQRYPDEAIGPNKVSLIRAKRNYKEFGASEKRFIGFVRKPADDEM